MSYKIAGIDVHKKVLMVVVAAVSAEVEVVERKRFATLSCDLEALAAWLRDRGVKKAVMESTAQYWKPVWYALEPHLELVLAQAFSNRGPKGRKHDFADAERLIRRLVSNELILSFVPDREQRIWRMMTRMKVQLARERGRVHSQLECLLEDMRIKLSSVVSDVFGISAHRILRALAEGKLSPTEMAKLGDGRLRCSQEQLVKALTGSVDDRHRQMLALYLDRLELVDRQMAELNLQIAESMKPCQQAVMRLADVPGFGADSAQQVIAEVGPKAATFASAANLTSWAGTIPGREESAECNRSRRSPKGNKYLRRVLTEVAQAAVKTKGSHFQAEFRRLLPRLGYKQALWAMVNRICRLVWKVLHEEVCYIEYGPNPDPRRRQLRAKALLRSLRQLGYDVHISLSQAPAEPA
jgi:transposase